MELFKNIFFNTDKLTPFSTIKITYAGKFFEDQSKEVSLHYSFNEEWELAKNIKMEKSELGYQAEIELNNEKSLNLCFFNEKNEWDNNDSLNYNFPIEDAELSLVSLEDNWVSTQFLSRFYLWKKKFKVRVYRIIRFITGNYKRKINEEKE